VDTPTFSLFFALLALLGLAVLAEQAYLSGFLVRSGVAVRRPTVRAATPVSRPRAPTTRPMMARVRRWRRADATAWGQA
jgi:hypothetical protein